MKQCNKCNLPKNTSEFTKDSRNKDGLQGTCNACRSIQKKRVRDDRLAIGNVIKVESKKCNTCFETKASNFFFRDAGMSDGLATICKECKRKKTNEWRAKNREHYNETHRAYAKKNYYKLRLLRYKLTPEDHMKMLEEQNHSCALCDKKESGKRPLAIDHCHKTGKVRGLLCYGCNRAIAILDKRKLLDDALAYLKS